MALAVVVALLAGCGDDRPYDFGDDSAIVFGVKQQVDPKAGAPVVTAGYELLRLGGRGFAVEADRVTGGTCALEDLAKRRGSGRIESGRAVFSGGALPAGGLEILANEDRVVSAPGASWKAGDVLSFAVEGFAIPPLGGFRFQAPSPDLVVTKPAPAGEPSALTVTETEDLAVAWTSPDPASDVPAKGDAVLVALTLGAGDSFELRCFYDRRAGSAIVPRAWVRALREASGVPAAGDAGALAAAGTLTISSQRQVTLAGRGGWVVYVVASAVARELPFLLPPP